MRFLAEVMSLHNELANRFFMVVGPLLFLYAGIFQFLGERIARQLLKKDTYCEKKIKIRPYFVFQTLIVVGVFCYGIILFAWYSGIAQIIVCLAVFTGYLWMFVWEPCAMQIRYTKKTIFYRERGRETTVQMSDISRMAWERIARAFDYTLVIYLRNGRKLVLHSAYYVGLNELKKVYDSSQGDESLFLGL